MKRNVALIFLACAATPAFAFAQPAADGKATVDHPVVAEVLKSIVNTQFLDEAIARRVGPMMYADNVLTPNESDLFLELLADPPAPTEITTQTRDRFIIPPASPQARAFLALSDPPDLNQLWLQGPEPMWKLIEVTRLNPNVTGQVQQFIADELYASWRSSTPVTNYRTIRATLSTAIGQWRLAGGDVERAGTVFLYTAMFAVDQAVEGKVPDDIYTGLRPAPVNRTN